VETLYLLGQEDRIVGVSAFVERPTEAKNKPKVSSFVKANTQKLVDLKPDLVLGFSDIQQDIARELIGVGLNVFIANHRSLAEVLDYILLLGMMVGESQRATKLVASFKAKLEMAEQDAKSSFKPKAYLEEWDGPFYSGIQYFSELVEVCGFEDIFNDRRNQSLAKGREVEMVEVAKRNPDIILPCWCGKKVSIDEIKSRPELQQTSAVKENKIVELTPEIFLQPGPALFIDGIDQLISIRKEHFTQE
jgi:iron complex transport system substrate-binding protein